MKCRLIKVSFLFFCALALGLSFRPLEVRAWFGSDLASDINDELKLAAAKAHEVAHQAAEHTIKMAKLAKKSMAKSAKGMSRQAAKTAIMISHLSHKAAENAVVAAKHARDLTRAALVGLGRGALKTTRALAKTAKKAGHDFSQRASRAMAALAGPGPVVMD